MCSLTSIPPSFLPLPYFPLLRFHTSDQAAPTHTHAQPDCSLRARRRAQLRLSNKLDGFTIDSVQKHETCATTAAQGDR